MKFKLSWKIGIIYLILIILTMVIFGFFILRYFQQSNLQEREDAVLSYANIVANQASGIIRKQADDKNNLDLLVREFNARIGHRVLIVDQQMKVAADSAGRLNGQDFNYREVTNSLQGKSSSAVYQFEEFGSVLYLSVPIASGKEILGAVFISADINDLAELNKNLTQRLVIFALISGLAAFFLSFLLTKFVTKPIERLILGVNKMSSGQYGYQVQITGHDELKQLGDAFNQMSLKIKSEDEIRKQFVANASHELKSPISSLKALLDNVKFKTDDQENAENKEIIEDIEHEISRMTNLVDNLLLLSRIEGNTASLVIEEIAVGELVEEVKRHIRPLADAKKQKIIVQSDQNIYWPLDGQKIFQVIYNILDNAVKYSAEKSEIYLNYGADDNLLVIEITDGGEGIPGNELENIFQRFYRVDKSRQRETGGTGLGLSIVQEIIGLHKGIIQVESELGKGTKFVIKLPMI